MMEKQATKPINLELDGVVAVVGLGYVGLPLAVALGATRQVVAYDIDAALVCSLDSGVDPAGEISGDAIRRSNVTFTTDARLLAQAEVVIVAVPTPIDATKRPDVSALESATRTVGENLAPGALIVFESTVYPGCTEDLCLPILELSSGRKVDEGFELAYSPERVVPGDAARSLEKVDKLVAGHTPIALKRALDVYRSVIEAPVHPVASIKVAEAAKVLENVQRDLNIALINECALIFDRAGIDTNEVIEAASTKWNFHSYRPGLVGGHCIGVDPYYLTHKAERVGLHPQVILAGRRINDKMGAFVADRVIKELIRLGWPAPKGIVTVAGLTFKEDIPDLRNTKVIDVIRELEDFGLTVQVHDPVADPSEAEKNHGIALIAAEDLKPAHAVVLAVAHTQFNAGGWPWINSLLAPGKRFVADIKGILPPGDAPKDVVYWRL